MDNNILPTISVLFTSTGRFEYLRTTIESFLKYNTYPNIEFLIVESIPTPISRLTFDLSKIETEKCIAYIEALKQTGKVSIKHFKLPWMPLGNVYNHLLDNMTGSYFLSVEDDCEIVYDPKEMFFDGMELLKDDPQLVALRFDLYTPLMFDEKITPYVQNYFARNGIPESSYGLKIHPISNYAYWPVAGGAPFGDKRKIPKFGGIIKNHPLKEFWWAENSWAYGMQTNNMYMGIMLKYYGCLIHIGTMSIGGRDWTPTTQSYQQRKQDGFFGLRSDRNKG